MFRTADHHPALTETAGTIGFGQTVKSHNQHVVTQRTDTVMRDIVINDLVVDLVSENDQIVLTGDFDHFQQEFGAVHRAGRVVRVDQHDPAGTRCDFGFDVIQIRIPVGLLITDVMYRATTGQRHGGSPERIIRCRHQQFITVVQQCLHRHDDQLAGAITDINVVHIGFAQPFLLIILGDRFTWRE